MSINTFFFLSLCILVSFVTRCVILVAQFRLELAMMELRVQLKVIRGGGGGGGGVGATSIGLMIG